MAAELAVPSKRNRTRSPSYPYLALPAALEKAAALWKAEGRHAVAVNVAMQHWGYKEESSTGYSCVAALKKFGLAEHEGMGENRQVRLSPLALTILLDNDPGSPPRRDALRTAALNPGIHAELWERYGAELPSEPSLKRFLVLERSFNEASVDELVEEYQQTMAFAGLGVGAVRGAASAPSVPVATATFAPLPPLVPAPLAVLAGDGSERRPEPPVAAPRMPARVPVTQATGWSGFTPATPAPAPLPPAPAVLPPPAPADRHGAASRQPSLFGDGAEEAGEFDAVAPVEDALIPERPARSGGGRGTGPWSVARRELPVPLDNDLVARVPYPMTEEDFMLLIDTLQLWKKRLVQPLR